MSYDMRKAINKEFASIDGKGKNERQPVSITQKKKIQKDQNYRCAECKKPLRMSIHYHHIKPVSKSGKSVTSNLIALCPTCHSDKHIEEKAKEIDKKRLKRKRENNYLGF